MTRKFQEIVSYHESCNSNKKEGNLRLWLFSEGILGGEEVFLLLLSVDGASLLLILNTCVALKSIKSQ